MARLRADTLGLQQPFLQLAKHALVARRGVPNEPLIREQAHL